MPIPAQKKFLVAFLIAVAIFLFLPAKVLAVTVSSPSNVPPEVQIGASFAVNGSLNGVSPGQIYFLKCRLGPDSNSLNESQTYNQLTNNWLSDSNAWVNMPIIEISGDPANFSLDCRVRSGVESGSKVIFLRACLKESDGSCKSSFQSNTGISFTALVEPTPTIPTLTPIPTPTLTSVLKATYKINEAKDKDGNILSSVKVYLDGVYLHHYAPETLIFCDGCKCDTYVDCGFGGHTIELQKTDYRDWSENKTINAGNNFEVNPVMEKEEDASSAPTPTPTPTPTPKTTPTPKLTLTPTPKITGAIATSSGEILGEESSPAGFYPLETTAEAESEKEATPAGKKTVLAKIFLGLGFLVLFGAGFSLWYTRLR